MKKILSIPLSLLLTTSLGLGCANADVKDTPQFGHSSSSNSQSSSTYSGGSSYSGGYASTPTYYSAPVQTAHKARPAKRRPAPKNYDGVYLIKDKTVLKNTLTNTDILKESVKNGVKHGFNAATSLASLPHAGYKIIKDPEIVLKDRGLRKQIVETTAFSAVGAVPGAVTGGATGLFVGAAASAAIGALVGIPAVLGGVAVGGGVGATLGATVLGSAAHGVVSGISATGLSIENAARRHDGYGPIQVNHAMADYQSPVQNAKEMIDLFGKGLVEEKGPSDLANGGKDSLEKITHTFDNTDLGKKINKVIERHHGDKK